MSQVINTNVLSLTAQRNLSANNNALQTSLQRLSSGLRINSAKDDAAGLAIADRFTSQINGFRQAARNANDGISFSQTAEGALSNINNNLQRIRELAVQSSNATNSADDRRSLDNEVQQLIDEISRVANQSEFNGQAILDGTLDDLFFQIGSNQGQTIAVSGVDARTTQLGASEVVGNGVGQDIIGAGQDLTFTGTVTITVKNALGNDVGAGSGQIAVTLDGANATTFDDVVRLLNEKIREEAESNEFVAEANLKASLRINNDGETSIVINSAFETRGSEEATGSQEGVVFTIAGGTVIGTDAGLGTAENLFATGTGGGNSAQVNLTEIDITTRNDAYQTITTVDGALNQIAGLRADLGAVQNRFEAAISNLGVSIENFSASRSRIQDTDFAAETAELTRVQILQQAGTSVLAQANASQQNVLALLQ